MEWKQKLNELWTECEKRQITKSELARRCGFTRQRIGAIFSLQNEPREDTFNILKKAIYEFTN